MIDERRFARLAVITLSILTAINFLNYIDRYVLASVLEGIAAEFELTDVGSGLLGSMFIIVYTLASPLAGYLGDRVVRKRIVAAGVLVWSLATIGSGFVDDYKGLLFMRALVGIGEAGYATVAPSIIGDLFDKRRRGRMLAYFYVAIPVGAALGYILGGVVAENAPSILTSLGFAPDAISGWRLAFLVSGAPGLAFGLGALFMFEAPRGTMDAGAQTKPPPHAWRRLFQTPGWRWNTVGMTLMTFTIGGLAFWMPAFMQRVHGFSESAAGTYFGAVTVIGGLVATLVGGRLGDWAFERGQGGYFRVSGIGLLIGAPLVLLTPLLNDPWVTLGVALLAEFFLFLNTGPLNAALVGCVPPSLRAAATAANVLFIHALGDAVSPTLVGSISHFAEPIVGSEIGALRLAVASTAIPVLLGGLVLIWAAKKIEKLPGGLDSHPG